MTIRATAWVVIASLAAAGSFARAQLAVSSYGTNGSVANVNTSDGTSTSNFAPGSVDGSLGVAFDASHDLLVGYDNNSVRLFDTGGNLLAANSTGAGGRTLGAAYTSGYYFFGNGDGTITRFTLTGNSTSGFALTAAPSLGQSGAVFATGAGSGQLATGPDGRIYVSAGSSILSYDATTGIAGTPITGTHLTGAAGIAFDPAGDLTAVEPNVNSDGSSNVVRFSGTTPLTDTVVTTTSSNALGITYDAAGNFYVTHFLHSNGDSVDKYSSTGSGGQFFSTGADVQYDADFNFTPEPTALALVMLAGPLLLARSRRSRSA